MNIYESLAKVQQELKATKDLFNKFGGYNYRSCESILEAVKPLLAKNGLALTLTDEIVQVGERIYVKATATVYPTDYDSGVTMTAEKIETKAGRSISVDAYAREEESKKGMDSCQVTGAASSYARKYALNGLFCIDDNKDSDATNTQTKEDSKKEDAKKEDAKPNADAPKGVCCERCGIPLVSYKGSNGKMVSVERHIEGSKERFGKVLCLDCIAHESKDS